MWELRYLLLVLPMAALLAAAPPADPHDLICQANAAFHRGDTEAAEVLYGAAGERTDDPGLVSFNKAAVLFQQGEYHAAEVHYARSLDDRACPPGRAAQAWFNRGTCLLYRGGSPGVFHSAIACFERCLDANQPDATLNADARHNLELAKLLWAEANRQAAEPNFPNEPAREDEMPQPEVTPRTGLDPAMKKEQGADASQSKNDTPPLPIPAIAPGTKPDPDGPKQPGDAPSPRPLNDDSTPQKLSPEETREYLRRTETRLHDERSRMLRILTGSVRPGVRDW